MNALIILAIIIAIAGLWPVVFTRLFFRWEKRKLQREAQMFYRCRTVAQDIHDGILVRNRRHDEG